MKSVNPSSSPQSKSPKENPKRVSNQKKEQEGKEQKYSPAGPRLAGKVRRRLRPRLLLSIPMSIRWRHGEEEPGQWTEHASATAEREEPLRGQRSSRHGWARGAPVLPLFRAAVGCSGARAAGRERWKEKEKKSQAAAAAVAVAVAGRAPAGAVLRAGGSGSSRRCHARVKQPTEKRGSAAVGFRRRRRRAGGTPATGRRGRHHGRTDSGCGVKVIRVRADPVRSHRFVSPKTVLDRSIASDGLQ
jgi:hypothetical protein